MFYFLLRAEPSSGDKRYSRQFRACLEDPPDSEPTSVTATFFGSCRLLRKRLMCCLSLLFSKLTASNWIYRIRIFLAAVSSVLAETAAVMDVGGMGGGGLFARPESRGFWEMLCIERS